MLDKSTIQSLRYVIWNLAYSMQDTPKKLTNKTQLKVNILSLFGYFLTDVEKQLESFDDPTTIDQWKILDSAIQNLIQEIAKE